MKSRLPVVEGAGAVAENLPASRSDALKVAVGFSPRGEESAFTLIEILVTMALLSFIVLGLLMMFNQTQRAFRAGLGQTDVLEGGRGAIDVLVRDLEQLTPSEGSIFVSRGVRSYPMNFWTGTDPNYLNPMLQPVPVSGAPLSFRTNVIQQFFVMTHYNQDWVPVFYRVVPAAPGSAVGSLYRYSTTWPRTWPITVGDSLRTLNNNSASTSLPTPPAWAVNRIADGVVHLRLRVFDTNGVPLVPFDGLRLSASLNPARPSLNNASSAPWFPPAETCFWSNAVPAYLELEMGLLETKTLQHYVAIDPSTPAGLNYLSNHVGQVHLFRQRIPIRNVDFTAYQ